MYFAQINLLQRASVEPFLSVSAVSGQSSFFLEEGLTTIHNEHWNSSLFTWYHNH